MSGRQRIDLWLWRTRLFKTRAAAARCVAAGGVRLERGGRVSLVTKAAFGLEPGDGLTVALPQGVRSLRVEGLPERRGPAGEARACYAELDAGPPLDASPPRAPSSPHAHDRADE